MDKLLGLLGLPSSTVLLGVVLALLAVGGWSYHLGDVAGANRVEADYSKRKDEAFEALRGQLKAQSDRADAAEAATRAVLDKNHRAVTALSPLLKDIRDAKPLPAVCMPDDLRRVLVATIRAINAYSGDPQAANAGRVPDALPAGAGTGR